MSDEEDYLSDKFIVEAVASSSQPKTYAERRQEALRQSRNKNEENRLKSRRQREQESREEGLRKNLFERAKEDSEGGENKALGIMLKMGFKIGGSLGQKERSPVHEAGPSEQDAQEPAKPTERRDAPSASSHRAEPLPLSEWSGKKGIGLGKRPRSPGAPDRLAKMAKMAEDASKETFRDLARCEYEERRADARLAPAQRTCMTLDERAGITFNVLWLNPNELDAVPKGLADAVLEYAQVFPVRSGTGNEAARLRDQMRADALKPVTSDDDENTLINHREMDKSPRREEFPADTVEEAVYFFRLGPRARLSLVLAYLRDKYSYCFWCGTQYEDNDDLEKHCPGPNEDDHD